MDNVSRHGGDGGMERNITVTNEPSLVLRDKALHASLAGSVFEYDEQREQIIKAPEYICEARSEKDKHTRLRMMTAQILAKIQMRVREKRDSKDLDDKEIVMEYADILNKMSSCNIVKVFSVYENTALNRGANFVSVGTRIVKEKERDDQPYEDVKSDVITGPESGFSDALFAAEENGYRKLNCTAYWDFTRALALAYRVGYIDANRVVQIDNRTIRAEDTKNEEERMRGKRSGR